MNERQRFWSKIDRNKVWLDAMESPCWEWVAGQSDGYGVFYDGAGRILAHRFSYELVYGKIPDSMDLHHRCLNKLCVNPDHLEALPILEHRKEKQLVCQKGHPMDTPESIHQRRCAICHRRTSSDYYYRTKRSKTIQ